MDQLQSMRTFVAVVDAGSFVGAVESTGHSKPAVSRHIAELEAYLGTRLLQRTTRRLSLTDEGERYYLHCKEILDSLAQADAEVSSETTEANGRLRISAPLTFGAMYLAALWPGFAAENPRVTLDIELSDRVVDLVEEGYDLAIRIGHLPDSGLIGRKLASTRILLCASPEYLAANGHPKHPSELAQHAIIAYTYWSSGNVWRFSGPEGDVSVRTHPKMQANNGDTCRSLGLAHQGIMMQPDFIVGHDLKHGRLVELMPDYRVGDLNIYAVYPTRKMLPPKVRRMVEYLQSALRNPSWHYEPQAPLNRPAH